MKTIQNYTLKILISSLGFASLLSIFVSKTQNYQIYLPLLLFTYLVYIFKK